MEPITEDQEWTLRRWFSTMGSGRPGKRDKAFLGAEKGLSEEQIDFWWKNVEASNHEENTASLPAQSASGLPSSAQPQDSSLLMMTDSNQAPVSSQPFHANAQFVPLNMEIDFPQEIPAWSPLEFSQEANFPSIQSFDIDGPEHHDPWPTSKSIPLISCAPGHGRGGGSYSSSLRTWDTLSTLVSPYDPNLGDIMIEEPETDITGVINPIELDAKKTTSIVSRFTNFNPIPEENGDSAPPYSSTDIKNQPSSKEPQIMPTKPLKLQATYRCTVCHRPFTRKGDWRRHEESHDPQTYWICMLTDPAIHVSDGWICIFCNAIKPTRSDIALHLTKKHKINECTNKHISNRKWGRKDKLKQHLQQMHNLADGATDWNAWHCEPSQRKWAWGCGFCGGCSFTWEGRVTHIAEHFEKQNANSLQWSPSLVVKGLLKQVYPDFNVSSAWRVLTSGVSNGDRYLQWSKEDAHTLQRKLEFHEGTPGEIAAEARVMSAQLMGDGDSYAWTVADSRVITLTSEIDYTEVDKDSWTSASKDAMSKVKKSPKQVPIGGGDAEISNLISNFF